MITIEALNKSYGEHTVLQNIHLELKRGEVNGIAGENGAGKTTLFKCLAGLKKYTGTIRYEGSGLLKNVTGFLPATPYFLSRLTGKEYLQLMAHARGRYGTDIEAGNVFDLPLEEYAENYSTGMQKKLAITGLLIQQNELFILDEPFNGVDIHSNIIIREIIARLKQANKIVVMSSHIFSTLNDSCDHLHHLKEGRIQKTVGKGRFEEIETAMKGEGIGARLDQLLAADPSATV
ncbi:ABC-2 type transport system ATP-binding protein [Filimonas zeae]|uniref:ABC transporter ATP-binding protein n=1 Tax=Filimonas zeae TaxID=1737353 RepID=A0A917J1M3_9BACT|nr:ATP-binding cassette domain-containing protein [Filimonas zeae]MDR6339802.1 ABC-2 type transport system ATP-binding protein [Filimonas zeae]GGH69720.1 ABC transporter ATP-binding protein [Filimonas zeae]